MRPRHSSVCHQYVYKRGLGKQDLLGLTSLASLTTSTTFSSCDVTGGGTILDAFLHPSRFVLWEFGRFWVLWGSDVCSGTCTDRLRSVWSSPMSSLQRTSKTWHTVSSWSSGTCGNVTIWGSSVKHSYLPGRLHSLGAWPTVSVPKWQ